MGKFYKVVRSIYNGDFISAEEREGEPEAFGPCGLFERVKAERAALLERSECARHYVADPGLRCGWHRQELGEEGMRLLDEPEFVFLERALNGLRCTPDGALAEWAAAFDVDVTRKEGYVFATTGRRLFVEFMLICTGGTAEYALDGSLWGDADAFWRERGKKCREDLAKLAARKGGMNERELPLESDRRAMAVANGGLYKTALRVLEALEGAGCWLLHTRDKGLSFYLLMHDPQSGIDFTARVSNHAQGGPVGEWSWTQIKHGVAEVDVDWTRDKDCEEKALFMLEGARKEAR